MFRFTDLIHHGMTMRDVRLRYPSTAPIFEEMGFRESCADCTMTKLAQKHGVDERDLIDRLNRAAFATAE